MECIVYTCGKCNLIVLVVAASRFGIFHFLLKTSFWTPTVGEQVHRTVLS